MRGRRSKQTLGKFAAWLLGVSTALSTYSAAWAQLGTPAASPAVGAPESEFSAPEPVQASVEYPAEASGRAEVLLELTIDTEGHPRDVAIVEGSPPFAEAAATAASQWQFRPARLRGRNVSARIRYTVRFEPEPEPVTPAAPQVAPAQKPREAQARRGHTAVSNVATEIVVEGERRPPGSATVTRGEARALPGTFGDPLRAVEAQPGVIPIVSGLPYFFVRGAPPANVGFFIDGVDVPLLYHAFFGPSVLHPGMIEDIELYAGSAPVSLGRFAGPIVAARTRPLSHQLRGEASVRLLDAGALVEAPFGGCVGPVRPGCARGSAVVSGRYSYTGLVLSLLSNTTLRYWDLQSQVSYQLGRRDQLSLLAFGAYDLFRAENSGFEKVGAETRFFRGDVRWDHEFSERTHSRLAMTLGLDRTGDEANVVQNRSIRGRYELDHTLSERASVRAALEIRHDDYTLDANVLESAYADFAALFPERTELITGGYVMATLKPAKGFLVVPGLRTDVYRAQGYTRVAVDPRISAVVEINPALSFEHSFGVAHQPPNFIPGVPGAQVADLRRGLQRALMASSGVRWKLGTALSVQVNAFRTAYFNSIDPLGGARDFSVDRAALERRVTMSAAGLELKISRPLTRRFGGFLAYTLSRTDQSGEALRSVSGFDRPHVLQAALSYDFGLGIRAGVRGVYYSGIPARVLGQEKPRFTTELRGDPYFRLDARLEKRWRLGRSGYLGVTAEVLNATYTKEVLRLDCGNLNACKESTAGPVLLPSVGVEGGI